MHLEHRFCRFEALFCGVYIFVLPSSVFSPLSSLFSPQNPQKCRFEPTFTKRRYKEALRAKKPDFMRLFAQTKRPEAVTKLPAFCKMTKRLEIVLSRDRHVGSNPTVSASRLNLYTITHQSCDWCVFLYLDNVDIPIYIKRLPVAAFFISWVDPHHLRHQTKSRRIFYFSSASFSL